MSSKRESDSVRRAKDILRGQDASLSEPVTLANALKEEKAFGHARDLLQRACRHLELLQQSKLHIRLIQQHALCTYKDPELPADEKFDSALTILAQLGDLRTTTDQETLGWQWASFPLLTLGMIGSTIFTLVIGAVIGKTLLRVVYFRQTLVRIGLGIGLSLFASLFARLHLIFLDPWYLRLGQIDRLRQHTGVVAQPPSTTAGPVITKLSNQQTSGAP